MNHELKKLIDEQAILEQKIEEEFKKLPNYLEKHPCGCPKTHFFPWIESEKYHLVWVCLNCGGISADA